MEYIQFLNFSDFNNSLVQKQAQNNKTNDKSTEKTNNKTNYKTTDKTTDKMINKTTYKTTEIINDKENRLKKEKFIQEQNEQMIICENINRGDYVKIIRDGNSVTNYYKGYIGEIKEYNKKGKYAMVCLLGLPYFRTIKLQSTHFIKITNVA